MCREQSQETCLGNCSHCCKLIVICEHLALWGMEVNGSQGTHFSCSGTIGTIIPTPDQDNVWSHTAED